MIYQNIVPLLLFLLQNGFFNPTPLNDLIINFNLKDSAQADKEFEDDGESTTKAVVIGGLSSKSQHLSSLEIFRNFKWDDFSPVLPQARYHMAAATAFNEIYVIGGFSDESQGYPVQLVTKRDNEGEWKQHSKLKYARTRHTATFVQNAKLGPQLIVTGGINNLNKDVAFTTEIYQFKIKEWTFNLNWALNTARYDHAAVGLFPHLYVIGGIEPVVNKILNDVEVFINQKWQKSGEPMKEARMAHGAVLLKDRIYVCGGRFAEEGKIKYRRSCEGREGKKWNIEVAPMNIPRADFGLVVVEDETFPIWAIGGFNDITGALRTVERYNPKNNRWKNLNFLLKRPRHAFAVARYHTPDKMERDRLANSTFV